MDTITGQYVDQFPRYIATLDEPPRRVHRLDRRPLFTPREWSLLILLALVIVGAIGWWWA